MRSYFVDRALEADPREVKLPAWAKSKLSDMRRATLDATRALDNLMAGTEPSSFWLESWEDNKRFYLPQFAGCLMFKSAGTELQLLAGTNGMEGWLNISGSASGIIAAPRASNVLYVRNQED